MVTSAPQKRAHASKELFEGEGLGQVIVCASLQALDFVRQSVHRGQH
jgi:hypothetical protein